MFKSKFFLLFTGLLLTLMYNCDLSKNADLTQRDQLLAAINLQTHPSQDLPFKKTFLNRRDNYDLYRIVLYPDSSDSIPTYFLEPHDQPKPHSVMICLQGHAPGMYISIGEIRSEKDQKLVAGGRDLALQAVANGWAAMTIEQRGFGEQAEENLSCNHLSLNLALEGKTMVGLRVADVSRAIDYLIDHEDIQSDKIACMGNSAGGTISYFAAAVDQRIKLAVVSCSFCTYGRSWLKYPHCACGYVPGLLEFADMPELAALIAPRGLLIVAGKDDYLADIEGVRDGFRIARGHYVQRQAPDCVALVEGGAGHQFYPTLAWPMIDDFLKKGAFEH